MRNKLKAFPTRDKANKAYERAKTYAVAAWRGICAVSLGVVLYIFDALKTLIIRARQEPFIFVAAAATVIYAVVAYHQWEAMREQLGVMRDQANAMQGQIDQMVMAERPWVMLTDVKPESLSSDDKAGVLFWGRLSVKNVGHLPAQNVSVTGQLLIHDSLQLPEEAMRTVCHEAQGSFVIPGKVLFPDQTQNVDGDNPRGFGILAEKIWAARDARIKSVTEHSM
jgi:hypothetical protein